MPNVPNRSDSKAQHSITFVHLGRKYYQITLWANTYFTQRKWVEQIAKQQEMLRERSMVFYSITLSEGFFTGPRKVNCAAPFSTFLLYLDLFGIISHWDCWAGFGRRVVYGTDDGVYLSDIRSAKKEPTKVLSLLEVTQVDVLEEYQLLIVLSGVI
jgi:RHO1 GDP-GTP exchange protein 1/2